MSKTRMYFNASKRIDYLYRKTGYKNKRMFQLYITFIKKAITD